MSYACPSCSHIVGKIYKCTSKDLDFMRERLSLDSNEIKIHKLGYVKPLGNDYSESRITLIEQDILKMKDFFVLIDERLEKVESVLDMLLKRLLDQEKTN